MKSNPRLSDTDSIRIELQKPVVSSAGFMHDFTEQKASGADAFLLRHYCSEMLDI